MKLIDLSQPVYDGAPNCPAHPPVQSRIIADHPADGWRMELITLASHTGSHVDAPLHKIAGGASLADIPLERFAGPAVLADLRGIAPGAAIRPEHLPPGSFRDAIVLLATGWGERRAKTPEWLAESPWLHPEAAQALVAGGARAVGIDHFSIGGVREPANAQTHEILLGAGLWILEDLFFPAEAFAVPQPLKLWALPINLKEFSGGFCRPVIEVC